MGDELPQKKNADNKKGKKKKNEKCGWQKNNNKIK